MECFVCVCITYRSYGGPEEGGWHYDSAKEHVGITRVTSNEELEKVTRELIETYNLKPRDGDIYKASRWDLSAAAEYRIRIDTRMPVDKEYPRPRYE